MNAFNDVVSIMTKPELKGFVHYLAARNKRHDTRNIDLYKALLENREEAIKKKIGSNAYNVLKKRLVDRLLDYMANRTLESESNNEVTIIKQLPICRKLFAHGKNKLAFKILENAEKQATRISHYTLLNEIYHTYIEYSYLELSPDQETIFEKFENNKSEFIEQESLNMAYAVIKKAYNAVEFDANDIDLIQLVEDTYKRFNISDQRGYNFQSLFQLAQITDVVGAYKKDYHSADLFFVDKIKEITGSAIDNEKHLVYHIEVLYLVANIYFRKRMFKTSLEYLESMFEQMQRFNKRYYKDKLIQYSTLLSLNMNYLGNHQSAVTILEDLFASKDYRFDMLLNPYLTRTMIYFQQGELNQAQKLLSQFNRTDVWYEKNIGLEWTLHKNYMEILLHIELGNVDYVDSRVNSLIRKYGDFLRSNKELNVMAFLKLVKKYYHNPEVIKTDTFLINVESTMVFRPSEQEDVILMSFYAWLKSKMENTPLYETTIRLVDK